MRPAPGEVLHFSEDPTITRFVPHVAATARQPEAYVWAVDHDQAPAYWFPRQCPRAMAWAGDRTTDADRAWLGPHRVHAVEYGWLDRMRDVALYAYRFDAAAFRPLGDAAQVATEPVEPLGPPEHVGDLLALHERAGIELRVLPRLWSFWAEVTGRSLEFSGIRLHNARDA
ncbi:DUF6886 family protein [Saccharothrix obliqua]|uniref:DUF6886 family protein n=1 Tax=Saccharothrix obliqua TaxID=2861747 RepID=UPI001C5F0427|nr:DUF6886 family protein [Saccharothrix obliqua]MBW4722127.1 hypothetical protein [Saccharothrix obliqua]